MVKYRNAEESDYRNINAFYNRVYGALRTLDEFYWAFHNAPAGRAVYVIAENEHEIIGTQGVIPVVVRRGAHESVLTGKSEDTLVDPEYRGQGIFREMYQRVFEECKHRGIVAIWGFTTAVKPFTNIGFQAPFPSNQCIDVNRLIPTFRYFSANRRQANGFKKLRILGFLAFALSRSRIALGLQKNGMQLVEREEFEWPDEWDGHQLKEDAFAIEISGNYLKWRIEQNPYYHEIRRFMYTGTTGEIQATFIVHMNKGNLADIVQASFAISLSIAERVRILKHLCDRLSRTKTIAVRQWIFDHCPFNRTERKIFLKAGFTATGHGMFFVWKEITPEGLDPLKFQLSRVAALS